MEITAGQVASVYCPERRRRRQRKNVFLTGTPVMRRAALIVRTIARMCDRIYTLARGRKVCAVPPGQPFKTPDSSLCHESLFTKGGAEK